MYLIIGLLIFGMWSYKGPNGGFINQIESSEITQNIYSGLGFGGVFKTDDRGWTYTEVNGNPIDSLKYTEILYLRNHPWSPDSVFTLLVEKDKEHRLFLSYNQGTDWYDLTPQWELLDITPIGLAFLDTFAFIGFNKKVYILNLMDPFTPPQPIPLNGVDTTTAFPLLFIGDYSAGTLILGTSDGLYISDTLFFWYKLGTGLDGKRVISATLLPPNPELVSALASVRDEGVFYLDTPTGLWNPSNLINVSIKGFHLTSSDSVIAFDEFSLYVSSDYGKNFIERKPPLFLGPLIKDITSLTDTIFVGSSLGLLISEDMGNGWALRPGDLKYRIVTSVDISPQNFQEIVLSSGGGGFYKSYNRGNTFEIHNEGLVPLVNKVLYHPSSPDTLYAGTYSGFYRSVNGGIQWDTIGGVLWGKNIQNFLIHPVFPEKIYCGTSGNGLWISNNGGLNWNRDAVVETNVTSIAVSPSRPQLVLVSTLHNGIFKSSDTGRSFQAMTGSPNIYITDIEFAPPKDSTIYAISMFQGVLRSRDAGNSWTDTLLSPPPAPLFDIEISKNNPDILYISLFGGPGVIQSLDGGKNFFNLRERIIDPLSLEIRLDFENSNRAYLSGFNGLYTLTDSSFNLNISTNPSLFTPEGDGINDSVLFLIQATDSSNIGPYYVFVYDTSGNNIWSFESNRASRYSLDTSITFYGYDRTGKQVPPGLYTVEVRSYDGANNWNSDIDTFSVDYIPLQTGDTNAIKFSYQRKWSVDPAESGGNFHLIYTSWKDVPEIYYTKSNDMGNTWMAPKNIFNSQKFKSLFPSLTLNPNIPEEIAIFGFEQDTNAFLEPVLVRLDTTGIIDINRMDQNTEVQDPYVVGDRLGNYHVVWSKKIGNNFEIFYRRYITQNRMWQPEVRISFTNSPSYSPYLLTYINDELHIFYTDGIPPKIRWIKGNISGSWNTLSDTVIANGEFPQAVVDPLSRIHLFRKDGNTIIHKVHHPDSGWGNDLILSSANPVSYSASIDTLGNLYVLWVEGPSNVIKGRIYDHNTNEWKLEQTLIPSGGTEPNLTLPHNGKFVYLQRDTTPMKVQIADWSNIPDTMGPLLTLQFSAETLTIGDSGNVEIWTNEKLKFPPILTITLLDTVQSLNVIADSQRPDVYNANFSSVGFPLENVLFEAEGEDLSGNIGRIQDSIYIKRTGTLLPEDYVVIWPNPARNVNEVHINYALNVNSQVRVRIYSIAGRLVADLSGYGLGGNKKNELVWKIDKNVSSGIYVVILEVEDPFSKEVFRVIKRVGVIK